jgi:glutaconate CoA-transferase subunit A
MGAFPSYAEGYYERSNAFYVRWGEISKNMTRFREWMETFVLGTCDFGHYLSRLREEHYV